MIFPEKEGSSDYELLKSGLSWNDENDPNIGFRLGQRAAQLQDNADHSLSEAEQRDFGTKSLLLKAAYCLPDFQEYAHKCVGLAKRILDREIGWKEIVSSNVDKELAQQQIAKEQEAKKEKTEVKKAA